VHELLRLSPEVAAACHENRPIVALESTLITFGLPWPANAETALAMERAVRECGAVPATIAVLGGQITVGLSSDQINDLAQRPQGSVRKCSSRDLPIAVGRGEDAATTVAATMIVAHKAGLKVFATGGIGGVHRGAPQDVSADLIELGRTPVAVVCAGAKAILDLPFTLEVLETQGVPIVGLGTDTLPGFYSRSSGLPIDTRVETPREAAAIIAASRRLGLERAVIIAVPVPEEHEFAGAEAAIAEATAEAERLGIRGKHVTPFLLRRVTELTGGASQTANSALLVNSSRAAALIARELCTMSDGAAT
jgi:pseudouridine-5'-phosphate glycosidase